MDLNFLFCNIDKINSENLAKLEINKEIENLKQVSKNESNRLQIIFNTEILCKITKKPDDYRKLIDILINILDNYNTPSSIIFRLRILNNISNAKYYIPVYNYLIDLLRQTMNTEESDESQSYDSLNITKVDAVFVLNEVKELILENLEKISDLYGFVEISDLLINALKNLSKGIYKEYFDNLINIIKKHSDLIRQCRTEKIPGKKLSSA